MPLRSVTDPSKVLMIECHELPQHREKGEGDYELRWGHKPDEVYYHDVLSLERELCKITPKIAQDILDRLQNFRIAYVDLATGEISS